MSSDLPPGGGGWLMVAFWSRASATASGPEAAGFLMSSRIDERDDRDHDHDRGRADRPAELERRVARDLRRLAPAARAEAEQRVEQDGPDHPDHGQADEEDDLVERVDLLRVRRRARLGREHVRPRGAGKHEHAATTAGKEQRDSGGPGLGSTSHPARDSICPGERRPRGPVTTPLVTGETRVPLLRRTRSRPR